jgi:hypothetical protein
VNVPVKKYFTKGRLARKEISYGCSTARGIMIIKACILKPKYPNAVLVVRI